MVVQKDYEHYMRGTLCFQMEPFLQLNAAILIDNLQIAVILIDNLQIIMIIENITHGMV